MEDARTVPMEKALKVHVTEGGVQLVNYQPGNGTRYCLMVVHVGAPFTAEHREGVGLSDSTQYVVTLLTTGRTMTLVESAAPIHCNYVQGKLGCGMADAKVLAELLGYLTGRGHHADRPALPTDHVVQDTAAPLMVECGHCHRQDAIPAATVLAARPSPDATTYPMQHTCSRCAVVNHFVIDLTDFEV